jgi:hypothetical protein
MDIEDFYDADPRRRHSEEVPFGRDWTDADGVRWEVNWVVDTGELYAMKEPMEPVEVDPLGDPFVPDMPMELVTVEVLGVVEGRDAVHAALEGWHAAMAGADSISWLRSRLPS